MAGIGTQIRYPEDLTGQLALRTSAISLKKLQRDTGHMTEEELLAVAQTFREAWDFEPSLWEAETVAALLDLPVVVVHRVPRAELEFMGRRPNACHANVRWYVENDPAKLSQAVTGWKLMGYDFLLHSVVFQQDAYLCLTPEMDDEPSFYFIPDTAITLGRAWRRLGAYARWSRNRRRCSPIPSTYARYALHCSRAYRLRDCCP